MNTLKVINRKKRKLEILSTTTLITNLSMQLVYNSSYRDQLLRKCQYNEDYRKRKRNRETEKREQDPVDMDSTYVFTSSETTLGITKLIVNETTNVVVKLTSKDNMAKQALTIRSQVILCMYYMKTGLPTKALADLFKVSPSTVSRTIHKVIPYMLFTYRSQISLNELKRNQQITVDCTTHRRDRVHPGQAYFYRGDKGFHFLTSQIVTDIRGKILNVVVARGRFNDPGLAKYSGLDNIVKNFNLYAFGDRAYSRKKYITPNSFIDSLDLKDQTDDQVCRYRASQAQMRIVVEQKIGEAQGYFKVIVTRSKLSPYLQAQIILLAFCLTEKISQSKDDYRVPPLISSILARSMQNKFNHL